MNLAPWFVAAGVILIAIALGASLLRRLPLSTSIVCLFMGVLLGPAGVGLLQLDLVDDATLIEQLTEVAVVVSLFTAGLQVRLPLDRVPWRISIRLATIAMTITVALIAGIGVFALGLPLGIAIILGALLAPTDPVLASDVQLENSTDSDPLRFVLTAEAGFNDGTAFPFVMLGLGIAGLHEIGALGWRWWTVDLVWAVVAGLAIGALIGTALSKFVIYLRQRFRVAVGLDNFLAVGLITLSYGAAMYATAYGFLAVFAAGVAVRRVELLSPSAPPSDEVRRAAGSDEAEELATDDKTAPAYMAESVLNFNAQLERFAEVALVVLIGSMLNIEMFTQRNLAFAAALVFIVRPLAVSMSLIGTELPRMERSLIAWFGVRGVGSLYYLSYAIAHGVTSPAAEELVAIALVTVTFSILLHGSSVTPLMQYYKRVSNHSG